MGTTNVSRRCTLPSSLSVFDCNLMTIIVVPAVATGAAMSSGFMLAYVDASNLYEAAIVWGTDGVASVRLIARVAASNTTLATTTVGPYAASGTWRLRARISDGTLMAKAWPTFRSEPEFWQATAAATAFTAAGLVGIRTILDTGNTLVTPVFQYDNFEVESLRSWTVTRSVNNTTKSHSAGADITLAQPLIWTL